MALLDLQAMENAPQGGGGGGGGGKSCNGSTHGCPSNLSVTLCGTSTLSVLACN